MLLGHLGVKFEGPGPMTNGRQANDACLLDLQAVLLVVARYGMYNAPGGYFPTCSELNSTLAIDANFDRSAPSVVGSQKKLHILVSD